VDRDSGQSRWFRIENTRAADVHPIVLASISREARLMTDEKRFKERLGKLV
jgi:hypothetical protein